ncbi:MAG: glycogen/starch/alpha-glucan phosphorylase [Gammaproteobacteria bacterium]|nr:glycogen/starch/alpha-glucan phosphorylase [Gammaproteobacteria bacterium]MBU1645941.1 glycogen/starch/alpha-glucan phosphorylase [Gammaproteobacteria bacterium]MBU1972003.1 glycogen/starch/alpha-glucan phosphorylase [Gammaproteobacteria bacterium]
MNNPTSPSPLKPLRTSRPTAELSELPPRGMNADELALDIRRYFGSFLGRDKYCRSSHYPYQALVLALRDRLMERWRNTRYAYEEAGAKHAYYLSLEFLMGRTLGNALLNLGLDETAKEALHRLGLDLEELIDVEHDAGLGNGGLGRLAACFLDSCATLQLPVMGYGIRYEYGMFRQRIENNRQVEEPDHWLRDGNPWELERPEHTRRIHYYGRTEFYKDSRDRKHARWVDSKDVLAVPFDTPIPGYRNGTVNVLRLWSAAATDEFDLGEFNAGSYTESVAAKNAAENITMVLYPNDASENGKELRLRQQYFLASASLQDVLERWELHHGNDFSHFADKNCFQLNDTHPTCAVPELMRLLMDEHSLDWEAAWNITSRTMAYTNHTLLPEALEKWPVRLFGPLLPRLLDIILEINARFLAEVARRWPGDNARLARMSLIEEGPEPQVRMAYLAIVGSFSVNGVAALHSDLLRQGLFRDFHELWPRKFNNKTNGVTQRRWLAAANPELSRLISATIGTGWITRLDELRGLARHADDPEFRQRWHAVKRANKVRLAAMVRRDCKVDFDPDALFDVQVKRMHEYKRQLLNILHVVHLYARLKHREDADWTPRCVLIGGKAAPGYFIAKRIITLIAKVAETVNGDGDDRLKVAFLPNYRVSAMEIIAPGTDLSEQISTAGKEASGTGNMKFMMNGAATIGTLDGANIEIREEVARLAGNDDSFFLFGLTAEEVETRRRDYDPNAIIAADRDLARVMDLIESGHFNHFEPDLFDPIVQAIRNPNDPWLVAADFRAFVDAQEFAAAAYRDRERWTRISILNTAASGKFSTDRTMEEYNAEIWKLAPVDAG